MAKNEVKLKIRIDDDGTLAVIAKKSDKASAAVGRLNDKVRSSNKVRNNFNKQEKGVGQLTNNSTKAFAKQASTIGGGLVPAYAALAANIFAITAAFGALRRAAALEQLEAGLIRVGNAAGANLPFVAQNLKEITNNAISTQAAMEATAIATSAGFDSSQLEQLTKVASGASKALGRDMEDALNRLVRGTAKLEPEILDELGIMVRLDDATRRYAQRLNKTEADLTRFEKTQAFLNATTEQGIKKFGDIASAVDPNPFDQLAAAFNNLSKAGLNIVNKVLTPIVNLLANNSFALVGATTLFGSTIVKSVVPALDEAVKRQKLLASIAVRDLSLAAKNTTSAFAKAAAKVKSLDFAPASVKALQTELVSGQVKGKQLATLLRNITIAETKRATAVKTATGEILVQKQAELASLKALKAEVIALQAAEGARATTNIAAQNAIASNRMAGLQAKSLELIGEKGALGGFGVAFASIGRQSKHIKTATGFMGKFAASGKLAANSMQLLGRASLGLLGPLGMILSFGSLLIPIFSRFFDEQDKIKTKTEEITDSFSSFVGIGIQLGDTFAQNKTEAEKFTAALKAQVGVLNQVKAGVLSVQNAREEETNQQLIENLRQRSALQDQIANAEIARYGRARRNDLAAQAARKAELESLKTQYNELLTVFGNLDKVESGAILQAAISQIENTPQLAAEMGTELKELETLLADVANGTITTTAAFKERFDKIMAGQDSQLASIERAQEAFGDFAGEVTKLGAKQSSAFDPAIEKLVLLKNEFIEAGKRGGIGFTAFKENAEGFEEMLTAARAKLVELEKVDIEVDDKGVLEALETTLKENVKTILGTKAAVQGLQAEFKLLNSISSQNGDIMANALIKEQEIIDRKREGLIAEQENLSLLGVTEERAERLLQIEQELATLKAQEKSEAEELAIIEIARVKGRQRIADLNARIAESDKKSLNAAIKLREIEAKSARLEKNQEFTAKDELDLFEKNKNDRIQLLAIEFNQTVTRINLEYDLLKAQLALEKAKADRAGQDLDIFTKLEDLYDKSRQGAIQGAADSFTASLQGLQLEGQEKGRAVEQAVLGASSGADSVAGGIFGMQQEGGFEQLDSTKERVQAVTNLLQPAIEQMKELGPEGTLVAAVAEGASIMANSFMTMSERIQEAGSGMEKGAAVAAFAGQAFAQVGAIMQASSDAKIATIDKEIAAEKKRDGKSRESVAKIQALERKKEAQKRKAFEQNKKVQMATTIANTAAAIMGALAPPPTGLGPVFGPALAAVAAAMGALQLSVIAGTSYSGGSSSAGGSMPSSVSVGKRRNTVDLATSSGGAGEIAYMRGGRGQGGPENFRPAFMGYKNRAEGGNTGFMVGEQGPEMFIPERPGRIIPADDIAAPTPVNANINISAIDAAGVEDVLINQRGNIISMIREAANAQGNTFLEEVNVAEL